MLGEPQQAQRVVAQAPGEAVAPRPAGGRPRPVLFGQVGGDKREVLVVGVRLGVGQAGHARHFGHSPCVAGSRGPLPGFDAPAVPGDRRRICVPVTGIRVAAVQYVADQRSELFAVVVFGFGDGQPVLRVVGQTEAVVVSLDGVVALVGRALGVGAVFPPAVNLPGAGFAVFVGPFASGPERNPGCGAQVALVGRVDEYRAAVVLLPARRTVEDTDRDDPLAPLLDVARLGVELAAGQDRNPSGSRLGEHLPETLYGYRRLEMVSVAAIARLRGIRAVFFGVMGFVQRHEAGEQPRRSAPCSDVRGSQSVGRESADVGRTFQDDTAFSFACGGDGGGDPCGSSAYDHYVVGACAGLGSQGQHEEKDMQRKFHGRLILTLNSRVSRLKPRTTSVYSSPESLSSAVSMRTVRLSPGIRQMKLSV